MPLYPFFCNSFLLDLGTFEEWRYCFYADNLEQSIYFLSQKKLAIYKFCVATFNLSMILKLKSLLYCQVTSRASKHTIKQSSMHLGFGFAQYHYFFAPS